MKSSNFSHMEFQINRKSILAEIRMKNQANKGVCGIESCDYIGSKIIEVRKTQTLLDSPVKKRKKFSSIYSENFLTWYNSTTYSELLHTCTFKQSLFASCAEIQKIALCAPKNFEEHLKNGIFLPIIL